MAEQTNQAKQGKKPTLEISLESMERIEENAKQWMLLEENYTQYGLNRREQLELAKRYFRDLITEIKEAYKTCPVHA